MDDYTRAAERKADDDVTLREPCVRRGGCHRDEFAVTVLDSACEAFLDTNTNRDRHWPLQRLLQLQESRGFRYEHLSVPYGDVIVEERPEGRFIVLKLVNDGYRYTAAKMSSLKLVNRAPPGSGGTDTGGARHARRWHASPPGSRPPGFSTISRPSVWTSSCSPMMWRLWASR